MSENLNVTASVKSFVDNVKKLGRSKKFIDSYEEYSKLSEYLNNSSNPLKNDTDKKYIKGLMVEYEHRYYYPAFYASDAMLAVKNWDDDTNKTNFDSLFGTSSAEGFVDAHNIIEVLANISDIYDFVDGIEDQDSDVNKASMQRIVALLNERLQILIADEVMTTDSLKYSKAVEALSFIEKCLESDFADSEKKIAGALSIIVRELSGIGTDGNVSFENQSSLDSFDIVNDLTSVNAWFNDIDDDTSKECFVEFFGDGTIENPGKVYSGNILEVLDNFTIDDLKEFIEDIEDQDSGDNINSMKRIVTLLRERLDCVVELGALKTNSSTYSNAQKVIDEINDYIKSGIESNSSNIANSLKTYCNTMRGVGASNKYRSVPAKELASAAMDAVNSWDDDTNKAKFDNLFGTGFVTDNNVINYANIVEVLSEMNNLEEFVDGIEDQDEGENRASMQRVVDLLKVHLEKLVDRKYVDTESSQYSRLLAQLDDIEIYLSEFRGSEVSIATTLRSVVNQLKNIRENR